MGSCSLAVAQTPLEMMGPLVLFAAMLGLSAAADKPNIVFFLMDDMGWNDCSWHNDKIKMPNIDEIRKTGVTLESNYVGPVCSPTRGSLMTGKYMFNIQQNHGVYNPDTPECLPLKEQLMGGALKELGYETHVVGKWHLGYCDPACLPLARGFDTQYGFYGSHINHWRFIWGAPFNPPGWEGYDWYDNQEYVNETADGHTNYEPELEIIRAQQLIADHDQSKPFFMYFASGMTHMPVQTPKGYESLEGVRETFEQMANYGDHQVGMIKEALEKAGMWEDTVFAFSADNGAEDGCGSNHPLRGWKNSMWEGGLRVPGFFHYGAGMDDEVKGTTTHDLMYVSDWFNTFLSMAGGELKEGLDSLDQSDFLLHGAPSARTEFVYNLDNRFAQPYGQAGLRQGDYKLILGYPGDCDGGWGQHEYVITSQGDWYGLNGQEDHTDGATYPLHAEDDADSLLNDGTIDNPLSRKKRMFVPAELMDARNQYAIDVRNRAVLFNIAEDPSETNDIAGENPDIVKKMGDRLKELYDNMPTSPHLVPDHDAARNPDYGGVWRTGWCPQIHDE